MNLIYVIFAFGTAVGLCTILAAYGFERLRRKQMQGKEDPFVSKTVVAGIGIGNLTGPQDMIARVGQNQPVRMSLNTVVMTPTKGLRFMSLVPAALLMWFTWAPINAGLLPGLELKLLASGMIAYAVMYISTYEVRYDSEGLSATDWLFRTKQHPWEGFISIRDDGHYLYKMRFETGRVSLQKHLVGMHTFLTFVTDIDQINKRH